MDESAIHITVEAVARNSFGRLIAYLAARSGDVAGAEDALGDAFVAALSHVIFMKLGNIPAETKIRSDL